MSVRRSPGVRKTSSPVVLTADEIAFVRSLVIYEDAEVMALNKPAGLSSQGGRGQAHTLDELLYAFVKPSGRRPVLVHRLDRDTSGVILTARTQPAAGFLGKAVMARRFTKTYLALLARAPERPEGVIDTPLRRQEIGREAYMRPCEASHPDAETALTRYRTLAQSDFAALVELSPETGRMHQLRVHLAAMGRPILGDPRYGGAMTAAGGAVPRLMLHAAVLSFPHPAGGARTVEAVPPEDFTAVARRTGTLDVG